MSMTWEIASGWCNRHFLEEFPVPFNFLAEAGLYDVQSQERDFRGEYSSNSCPSQSRRASVLQLKEAVFSQSQTFHAFGG